MIKQIAICPYCKGECKLFGAKGNRTYVCDECRRLSIEENIIFKEVEL